jgi:hypothetical protein
MPRPGVVPITRITKIYDLVRGFDWVNKAGICELVIWNSHRRRDQRRWIALALQSRWVQ